MRKQETALSSKEILKLIGKPTPATQYPKTNNPAVVKLLKQYNNESIKVYKFFDVLKKLGWIDSDFQAFKSNVRKTSQRLKTDITDTSDCATEDEIIDEQIRMATEGEIEHLKNVIADQTKQIKKLMLENYNGSAIVRELSDAIDSVRPDRFSLNVRPTKATIQPSKKFYNILPISDAHFGEVVIPDAINGLNAYNTEISKKRHIKLFEDNYEFAKIFGCEELHLFFLGDIFSGNIHGELRETNEKPVTECLIDYYKFIVGLINSYASLYKKIVISCVVGNHARNTDRYQFKNKGKDNYEYLLYGFMKHYYENPDSSIKNVQVNTSDSTVLFAKVGEQNWKLEHGDRYKGGGSFVSPLSTVVRDNFKDNAIFTGDMKFDAVMMGHWHISAETFLQGSNIPVYLNASIIGPGEYSLHNLHSAFPAQSCVYVTDGKKIVSKGTVDLGDIK